MKHFAWPARTNDESNFRVTSKLRLFEGSICIRNSFFDIKAVQVNLSRFAILHNKLASQTNVTRNQLTQLFST